MLILPLMWLTVGAIRHQHATRVDDLNFVSVMKTPMYNVRQNIGLSHSVFK